MLRHVKFQNCSLKRKAWCAWSAGPFAKLAGRARETSPVLFPWRRLPGGPEETEGTTFYDPFGRAL
jgi:hypothetical protein